MTNTLRSPLVSRPSRAIRSLVRGLVAAGLAIAAIGVAGLVTGDDDRTVQAIGEAMGAGGEYHALTPQRILDTRDGNLEA